MASTALENHPLRRPDVTLPDVRDYPEGESNVMPSLAHERARTKILEILLDLYAPTSLVALELAILRDPHNWRDHLVPDILVALGAGEIDPMYHVLRRQYRLWDEDGPPHLVIEFASRTTIGRDNVGKRVAAAVDRPGPVAAASPLGCPRGEDYAAMGVREYVQFDPLEEFLRPGLQVYQLDNGSYQRVQPAADGALPSGVLDGYDWVQQGILLRLRDRTTGKLVPTPQEARDREAERARMEAERAQAAERSLRDAEAARVQAEEARARDAEAEMERLRAEIARLHARQALDDAQPDRDR
jgi:Uma2 family endonuclease